jgi:manganese/zinc/iron transport system substrate-binding protein
VLCVSVLLLTGCGAAAGDDSPGERYTVVTTTGMVGDIVRHVAGDRTDVVGLMGEGVDPHLYKPTRRDVVAINDADVIFYSGLMLEGRMSDTLIKASRSNPHIYPVTEVIDETYLLEPEGFAGHWDPHVWMDVSAWSQCVDAVAEALGAYDPDHADEYRNNAEGYRAQLAELDSYVRQVIASIPESQRVLVTAHDAFNYFGRAYGVTVMGIQGISTESEAGLDDINRLVDFLVENEIRAVFVETSVSDRNVKALLEGSAARGHQVIIGGSLFSDAMGAPGSYEGTYVGMIDHNATTIARALGGEAPAGGMSGKLGRREP